MKLETWLGAMAAAATLGFVAVPAQAAPAGRLDALEPAGPQTEVQNAHWYDHRYGYRYGYGPRYRHYHYGYRPGYRFYYGPRHHRRHWHYRHW